MRQLLHIALFMVCATTHFIQSDPQPSPRSTQPPQETFWTRAKNTALIGGAIAFACWYKTTHASDSTLRAAYHTHKPTSPASAPLVLSKEISLRTKAARKKRKHPAPPSQQNPIPLQIPWFPVTRSSSTQYPTASAQSPLSLIPLTGPDHLLHTFSFNPSSCQASTSSTPAYTRSIPIFTLLRHASMPNSGQFIPPAIRSGDTVTLRQSVSDILTITLTHSNGDVSTIIINPAEMQERFHSSLTNTAPNRIPYVPQSTPAIELLRDAQALVLDSEQIVSFPTVLDEPTTSIVGSPGGNSVTTIEIISEQDTTDLQEAITKKQPFPIRKKRRNICFVVSWGMLALLAKVFARAPSSPTSYPV